MSSPVVERGRTTLDLKAGVIGSLAGGVIFGIMIHVMGKMGEIAGLIGPSSVWVGWVVHLVVSLVLGCLFAFVAQVKVHPVISGLLFGAALWAVFPLTLMPLLTHMPLAWSAAGLTENAPYLIGHLVYGLFTGWVYQKTAGASV